jgi:hypothetical protein
MRIGSIYEWKVNAHYRVMIPLDAMRQRGHEVVAVTEGVDERDARSRPERLRGCEVIHGYRLLRPEELRGVQRAIRGGAAFVWDTDDDLSALPRESPNYRQHGGGNAQRIFAHTVEIARTAHVVTASTEALAARYREAGIEHVEVVENRLRGEAAKARRRKHDGLVVGWTAGLEHASELPRIPIVEALTRLLDTHPELTVASLGLDLGLPADRYRHVEMVPFHRIQEHVGGWDVALAPLADIPFNRTRSDVKLKEYAGAGTPWLASPVGPYVGLGEEQGGRLVPDDGWYEAIDQLLRHRFERFKLSRKARAWAKSQTFDGAAERWEGLLRRAVELRASA